MMSTTLDMLPATSLVACPANRLSAPDVLWTNQDAALGIDLPGHSYCTPLGDEPASTYRSESKTFYAERYGGEGVGHNGGGVRCAALGNVQVKGFGRTPLYGQRTDFWHRHGGASVHEAVREALWGEVCQIALPFGGIRTHGIVLTGSSIKFNSWFGERVAPRALIIREGALRPAHYMQAVFFDPTSEFRHTELSDSCRTREAVARLTNGLGHALRRSAEDKSNLNELLMLMLRRFAEQYSAARMRKLFHGTLNCSNICLDGRWIDFGTITTVSDYGRIFVVDETYDQTRQHLQLARTLENLAVYHNKFLPPGADRIDGRALLEAFDASLVHFGALDLLRLTGVPEAALAMYDSSVLQPFVDICSKLIATERFEPFKLAPDRVAEMPSRMGRVHLNTVLTKSACCDEPAAMDLALAQELPNPNQRSAFVAAYHQVRKRYEATLTADSSAQGRTAMILNCLRLNAAFPELYAPVLHRAIDALDFDTLLIERFITNLTRKARSLFSPSRADEVDLCGLANAGAAREPNYLIWRHSERQPLRAVVAQLDSTVLDHNLEAMATLYA